MAHQVTVIYGYSPPTLQKLSVGCLFDLYLEESISTMSQLTINDAVEAALLMKRNRVNITKYESIKDSYRNDSIQFSGSYEFYLYHDCSIYRNSSLSGNFEELKALTQCKMYMDRIIKKYDEFSNDFTNPCKNGSKWENHPICQTIYNEDGRNIIENYNHRKDIIFSLPQTPDSGIELEGVFYYHDPLVLFPISRDLLQSPYIVLSELKNIASSVIKYLRESLSVLEKSSSQIRGNLHCLLISSCLQIKYSASSLLKYAADRESYESHPSNQYHYATCGKEELFIKSLDVIICTKNLMQDIESLKENIFKIIDLCNFIPLEDAIEIFNNRISTAKNIISRINISKSNKKSDTGCCGSSEEFFDNQRFEIEQYEERSTKTETLISSIDLSNLSMTPYLLGLKSPDTIIERKLVPFILESKMEICKISSFLKIKYPSLIVKKMIEIEELRNKTITSSSIHIKESIKNLEKDIEEMKVFLKNN
ncbi:MULTISPECIES: hypothetical protein [Candidatus Ichthyocystis]|uniref:Uncharacterized protein n=1 Tax=Candidatus Ichthyocystis hellenicum TaxID=1561003 RepID=A0A0S4M597_9BURK|nr:MULTISPECIES: hypothetical protein [Ichthyocystis]CUT18140.1 hypothetical protein Ark11_1336 [Candidatus Ichthyocystis hellenicum]